MVTWTRHWKQCNFGNQNFLKLDSFSESLEKNEYAFQKLLTSILFDLFDFEVRDADCWWWADDAVGDTAGDSIGNAAGDSVGDAADCASAGDAADCADAADTDCTATDDAAGDIGGDAADCAAAGDTDCAAAN